MQVLNDSRIRAVLFGLIGGAIGSLIAEAVLGTPQSLAATIGFGCVTGLGIGALFGISEGLGAGASSVGMRAALIGGLLGVFGGGLGSGLGQAVAGAGGGGGSVFSGEMAKRLREAGAKEGEIEIGLIWRNTNDIDLHVLDPRGEEISFSNRRSRSGGELDVDRNASCGSTTSNPVEHIVWESGAPHGQYKVGVHHYASCGPVDPTPFDVEIGYGGHRHALTGSVSRGDPLKVVYEFDYAGPVTATAATAGGQGWLLRLIGWTVFGVLVGAGQGLARRSGEAVRNLALGGAIGGAAGGLGFLITAAVLGSLGVGGAASRLIGMAILGAAIGLCMVVAEQALSAALMVVNGRYEGRRIPLDRPTLRLGRDELAEIYLGGDPAIAGNHCTFTKRGGRFMVEAGEGTVEVNGVSVASRELAAGDRLQVGSTRLLFRTQAVGGSVGSTHSASPVVSPTATQIPNSIPAVATPSRTPAPPSPAATRRRPPPPPPPPRKT
jgi:pSer/pThr/pTyr-binding forkhead associated (FHA) protein